MKDQQIRLANERIDRLVEALAHKQAIPIIMPQAEVTKAQPVVVIEKGSGWFDMKPKVHPNSSSGAKP